MYRIMSGFAPSYPRQLFLPVREARTSNLRGSDPNMKILGICRKTEPI